MADDRRLERMEKKLDFLDVHLNDIDLTLRGQHLTLQEHMRRTNLLEKDILPIKRHVHMMQGAFALIVLISIIAGIIVAVK